MRSRAPSSARASARRCRAVTIELNACDGRDDASPKVARSRSAAEPPLAPLASPLRRSAAAADAAAAAAGAHDAGHAV